MNVNEYGGLWRVNEICRLSRKRFFQPPSLTELLTMIKVKSERELHPSRLERQVSAIPRYDAEREAPRIPWPILQEAREKYIAWEAFGMPA